MKIKPGSSKLSVIDDYADSEDTPLSSAAEGVPSVHNMGSDGDSADMTAAEKDSNEAKNTATTMMVLNMYRTPKSGKTLNSRKVWGMGIVTSIY